jgi:hypothetical protein
MVAHSVVRTIELRWRAVDVAKLVLTTVNADKWCKEYGRRGKAKPQLILVKDEGIYIISNKVYPDGKSPSSEGEVAYADGFNPKKVPFDQWWETAHDISGDDFGYYLKIDSLAERILRATHNGELPLEEVLGNYDFVLTMEEEAGWAEEDGEGGLSLCYGFKQQRNFRL